jgi:alkyl sulfatase BDS1-like metallo-beta-lactamase superfamily hydrolase
MFGADTDVVFASHHWPTWDRERILTFLSQQRDLYAYLHDQTLRMLNKGLTGIEIAEDITLPPQLDDAWHARGYYGSVSHNVKAIYQRYLGWFDGNPTSLWQHPPKAQAIRYVETIGGVDTVLDKARGYVESGDLRFAAELLKHAVFAEPENSAATEAIADVYTRLGLGAENPTWRNYYLTGAHELRVGVTVPPIDLGEGMATALSIEQLLDTLCIRLDGLRAASEAFVIDWNFTDTGTTVRLTLSNGALTHVENPASVATPDLALTLTKVQLLGLLAGRCLAGIDHTGDPATMDRLLGLLDNPDPGFAIITP